MPCRFIAYPEPEDIVDALIALFIKYLPGALADIKAYREEEDIARFGVALPLTPPKAESYFFGSAGIQPGEVFVLVDPMQDLPQAPRMFEPNSTTPEIVRIGIDCYVVDDTAQRVSRQVVRYGAGLKRVIKDHPRLEDPRTMVGGDPTTMNPSSEFVEMSTVTQVGYGAGRKENVLYRYVVMAAEFRINAVDTEF
jgi:hypothetical protein